MNFTSLFLAAGAQGTEPHPLMLLPFAILLLLIAIAPFINAHLWERHYHLVAVGLGLVATLYYVVALGAPERMLHAAEEYAGFMSLIGALFVVAGGIHLRVKGEATPLFNCGFLAMGAALANVLGTTGASMLLIRPWLRMNKYRVTEFHVVFFILIVSNVGGCLTPIGDPPLFLGFLRGVPFLWVAEHLWPAWLLVVSILLGTFYVLDRRNFLRAPAEVRERETGPEQHWHASGLVNLPLLGLALGCVFLPAPWRELGMVAVAVASYFLTPKSVHQANDFSFGPLKEVAWLFLGIFATMVPALDYLERHAASLGLSSPMSFYLLTGTLSALLDNAPTYLTFLTAALGLYESPDGHVLSVNSAADVRLFVAAHPLELMAISLGAVFFGAMTYIGNGPNLMVKSIAERSRVRVPSFFGYVGYTLCYLLPPLLLAGWIFLRTP